VEPQQYLAVAEALTRSWALHQPRNLGIMGTSHLIISMRALKR
jgi:hypothetical protein